MLTPAILLIFGLIVVYGRVGQVNGTLESSTRDGARSATRAHSTDEARTNAVRAVRDGIKNAPSGCLSSLQVKVGEFVPGQPLTVRSTCTYAIGDAGIPGAPGTLRATAEFVAVVDQFRSVDP